MPPLPQVVDFLHPRVFMGTFAGLPRVEDLTLQNDFPVRGFAGDKLIGEIVKYDAPLASFGSPGAESPRFESRPLLQQVSVDMVYVRSKIMLKETDVRHLRLFGDQPINSELGLMARVARERIADDTRRLDQGVDRRIEKMCADTMLGSLTVTPAMPDNLGHSEITFTLNYPVNLVTAGDAAGSNTGALWSDLATADILLDVQNWFQSNRYSIRRAIVSRRILNLIARNTKLRSQMFPATPTANQPSTLTQGAIQRAFQDELGITLEVYESTYTTRTWALVNGIPTPTDTERRYLPDNKVIFLPEGDLGFYASSPVPMNNFQTGKYLIPLTPEMTGKLDPYVYEVIAGIYGIPFMPYADRVWVATVAA